MRSYVTLSFVTTKEFYYEHVTEILSTVLCSTRSYNYVALNEPHTNNIMPRRVTIT